MIDANANDPRSCRAFARAVARKYVRADVDVEDVVQDAMLRAHRFRDSFRAGSSYASWLYRVVANTAISFLRQRRRCPLVLESGDVEASDDVRASMIARDDARIATAAARRLGDDHAQLLWLRYGLGKTEDEIARDLGVTVSSVKMRAFRARRAARAELERA